ncbi:hypothetical protein AB0P36_10565 [Streptomyces flavidovirens]|uniref:hypothetical protein n=1 Tax=Streptomyces flavidovirens TaxID=67298 RepID=UPI003431C183
MALTISLVILFGIALVVLLKFKVVGFGSAFIAMMFGFYLASTGAADTVNDLMGAVIDALPDK